MINSIKRAYNWVKEKVKRFWRWLTVGLVATAAVGSLGLVGDEAVEPVAEEEDTRIWYEVPVQWDESMRAPHGVRVLVNKDTGQITGDIQDKAAPGTLLKNAGGDSDLFEEVIISKDTLEAIMRSYASSTPEVVKDEDAKKREIEDLKKKIEADGGDPADISRLELLLTK